MSYSVGTFATSVFIPGDGLGVENTLYRAVLDYKGLDDAGRIRRAWRVLGFWYCKGISIFDILQYLFVKLLENSYLANVYCNPIQCGFVRNCEDNHNNWDDNHNFSQKGNFLYIAGFCADTFPRLSRAPAHIGREALPPVCLKSCPVCSKK